MVVLNRKTKTKKGKMTYFVVSKEGLRAETILRCGHSFMETILYLRYLKLIPKIKVVHRATALHLVHGLETILVMAPCFGDSPLFKEALESNVVQLNKISQSSELEANHYQSFYSDVLDSWLILY